MKNNIIANYKLSVWFVTGAICATGFFWVMNVFLGFWFADAMYGDFRLMPVTLQVLYIVFSIIGTVCFSALWVGGFLYLKRSKRNKII